MNFRLQSIVTLIGLFVLVACVSPPRPREFQWEKASQVLRTDIGQPKGFVVSSEETGFQNVPEATKKLTDLARELLKAAGLGEGTDGQLHIEMRSSALGGSYSNGYQYSGAGIAGTISIRKTGGTSAMKSKYESISYPPHTIFYAYPTPGHAPFLEVALSPDSFAEKIYSLIHDLYGPAPLVKALQSKNSTASEKAALVLGDFATNDGFLALKNGLESKDEGLVRTSIRGLGRLRETRSAEALLKKLPTVRDEPTRHLLYSALGDIRDPIAVEPLVVAFLASEYSFYTANPLFHITGIRHGSNDPKEPSAANWRAWLAERKAKNP